MHGLATARSGGRIFLDSASLLRWGSIDSGEDSLDLFLHARVTYNVLRSKDWCKGMENGAWSIQT
eukprot:7100780-Pyramimonas_sp.AAC.1